MGRELATTVRVGRETYSGTALLETAEILFRGETRLKIPFAAISDLQVSGGSLKVTHASGIAAFKLGDQAAVWADKIRNPKSRIDKFGIKPEHKVAVVHLKDADLLAELRARARSVSNGRAVKDADVVFVGAESLEQLERIGGLVASIKRDGAIWTVTPKGKGGIRDTDVMATGKAAGLVDVKVVSFSDTHSANKFVIPKADR